MQSDIIIVGAGAAGSFAALVAAQMGKTVTVFEKNDFIGRKLRITGKGRCNLTNNCSIQELLNNVPVNSRFLYSAFSAFNSQDVMDSFENLGVSLKTERGNRVFPVSDNAAEIVDALANALRQYGVKIIHKRVISLIIQSGVCIGVRAGDTEYSSNSVLIACGGKSYPVTGSTGDGYMLAESAGHSITPTYPSLVPLVSVEKYCSELMGLSLRNVVVKLFDHDKLIYSELGEMLFTHFGVSGPLILSASSHMREMEKGRYKLLIDLKPALDEKKLDERIQRDFAENQNRDFVNAIRKLLPAKLIPVAVRLSGIPENLKINAVTKEQRRKFAALLKAFPITVADFRPIDEAIVTSGGVCVKEINPKTMESKLVKGLFFAGEVIDVDAYTGGFNLQIAFSTAHSAALNM